MNTKLKNTIIELADNSSDEICGFIYTVDAEPKIYQCKNISDDPTISMEISMDDQFDCLKLGKIVGVYHSHPNGPDGFSEQDLASAEESGLPFYVYNVVGKSWLEYIPKSYDVKIEGRTFVWGFDDCYGAARHYYREKLGLYLKDYDRDDTFGLSKSNAIMENFEKEGFVRLDPKISPVRIHDALIFDISNNCPQHIAIFVANQRMFHHPLNKLSRIDLLDGRYLHHLVHLLRYKTLV